jgi:putative NADPH-quinone reductase
VRIAIVQGHPDPSGDRFGHALARAYAEGAHQAGHEVRTIDVARLDFPLLRTKDDFENGAPPQPIRQAQDTIAWAEHLLILYPLWLGTMPAILKAFLEQVFRPRFVSGDKGAGKSWSRPLKGRSARVVVTMGMPALVYRWYFRAHSLKSLERNVLRFCGIAPVRDTLIGMVESKDGAKRERWVETMRAYGRRGT